METISVSAGAQPALDTNAGGAAPSTVPLSPEAKRLIELHHVKTCGQCKNLNKNRGTLDGYKWCDLKEQYTMPTFQACEGAA